MQKISPFLWFKGDAEDAVDFYTSIFDNSKVVTKALYGPEGPGPDGSVMAITFELDGQTFSALSGNEEHPFTMALSLFVHCKTQAEVDRYWEKLSAGGKQLVCGWLEDKFGVSWQIVPDGLIKMISDKDPVKAGRVMAAMMKMTKLDKAQLEAAYNQT
jgi:predicted 3-demethylubiquinone-9 3-methyltransferase (glyoxalase superfamily)